MSKETPEEADKRELERIQEEQLLWLEQPYSQRLRKRLAEAEQHLIDQLIGAATVSTDPRVCALGSRILSSRQYREHFERPPVEEEHESR